MQPAATLLVVLVDAIAFDDISTAANIINFFIIFP